MIDYLQLMKDLKLINLVFDNHDVLYDNELMSLSLTKINDVFYIHWEICRSEIMIKFEYEFNIMTISRYHRREVFKWSS